jgi:peptide/nickel transport system substrate-binding protein/oligopeptide transport system substrate-binding protein
MDAIRITFNGEYEEVTGRFNSNDVNWARGGFDLATVTDQDAIVVNPLFATSYFQFSAADEPFSDARVRRALALLLPWEDIRSEDYLYIPAVTLVPSFPQYPDVSGITESDSDLAMELLAAAGYPKGDGLQEVTISIPGGGDNDRIAEIMKTTWESLLDVEVVVERIPYPDYFSFIEEETFTLGTISWIGDFADPLTFLDMWTSESNLNNSRYSNTEFDVLVRRAMGESAPNRYETLADAERILLWDAIVLPISHSPSINLVDLRRVRGWYPNPLDIHPFKYLEFIIREPPHNVASR